MKPTRRQFFGYTAALTAASAASWLGHRFLNPQPTVRVNRAGLPLGHLLRDGGPLRPPQQSYECDTLVLGSGAAGLSAVWYLAKHGRRDILLAEGFERNGNNAAFYSGGQGAPTGAHYLALPSRESSHMREMLADLGMLEHGAAGGMPVYRETDLVHAPQERLLHQGRWQDHLLPQHDADARRFFALIRRLETAHGRDGRKIFAIPIALSSADPEWRRLDRITFGHWLMQENYRSPSLLWYLDYCCRDDYGQGSAEVSAFAGLHYFAARNSGGGAVLTWPDGLARISEALRRRAGIRPAASLAQISRTAPASYDASAFKIREHAKGAEVWLRHNRSGTTASVRARRVISAMPLMVAARILDRAEEYGFQTGLPEYAPWLVANFVFRRFPAELYGGELAWDNVVYGSAGLGYVAATHQLIRTAKPAQTIFTAYRALNHDTPQNVRRSLLEADGGSLLETAAEDLFAAYGRHVLRHIKHADITLRAHAMSIPRPGYLSSPALHALRRHDSAVVFAHSDLSGYSVFEEAAYWGIEAAKKVLAA